MPGSRAIGATDVHLCDNPAQRQEGLSVRSQIPSLRRSCAANQLTFVMPVTLREDARLGSTAAWRRSPDGSVGHRLRFGLASLWSKFNLSDLCELLVICPGDEVDDVTLLVRTVSDDERIRVISELDVCPDVVRAVDSETGSIVGWRVQQMLKLAAAARVTTPFYLTLDSDVVCIREFSSAELIDGERGVCGVETAETYRELYVPDFAEKEARRKEARIAASMALLGGEREERYAGRYPSETPVLYHTESMREMCSHLSDMHEKPWSVVLAQNPGWTEMALYFSYLESTGRLGEVYEMAGPNRVLHLEGSVWHGTDRYRGPRRYDAAHFDRLRDGGEGLFIAVQSWLANKYWLPATGFGTIEEFYAHMGRQLGVELR